MRIGETGAKVAEAHSGAAQQHQLSAAQAIDKGHGNQGENQIDGAGDDDVKHDAADAEARAAINLLGVVEEDVDPAPLLQCGQRHADPDQVARAFAEEIPPADPRCGRRAQRLFDGREFPGRVVFAADARQHAPCFIGAIHTGEPARALGNEKRKQKKQNRRNRDRRKHPAPAELRIPGLQQDSRSIGNLFRDAPVDDLRCENAANNGQLIEADKTAAPGRGADFGDIERGNVGGKADGHSAGDAPHDEHGEDRSPAGEDGGKREQQRREKQHFFAAEAAAHHARDERADETADERATVGPTDEMFGVRDESRLRRTAWRRR